MSSDEILFDSEEMDSQNKENITTHNENITLGQTKEMEIKSKNQENLVSNEINEQSSNEPTKEFSSESELVDSQSSQEILDSIGKHSKRVTTNTNTETFPNKDIKNLSPDILESQTPVDNLNTIVHDKPSMEISETPIENVNNPPGLAGESVEFSENLETNRDYENLNPSSNDTSVPIFSEVMDESEFSENTEANRGNMENLNQSNETPIDSELMEESEAVEETPVDSEVMGESDAVEESQEGEKVKSPTSNVLLSSDKEWSLPLSRVKMIMKTDPNVNIVSAEATILAAIAAEHFTKFITRETVRITLAKKKKTLLKNHLDEAIQGLEVTEFLEGMMDD